jgi:hypothetical protein
MTRGLSSANQTEIGAAHLHEVVLVKLEFDTPVYVHSGIGTITYDSNDYLGVGDFGGVSETRESESLGPAPITLQLSGVDSSLIGEALDSGNYGDVVTIYVGYRQDDGTLVADPWVVWKGWYENSAIQLGTEDNVIAITCQHDLAVLEEADGGKFTDEDQKRRFSGDTGFEYVHEMRDIKLNWGGGVVTGNLRRRSKRPFKKRREGG